MKYEWVLFDADETLFHFDAYKGLQLMFSRYGITFSEQDFHHYETVNKPLWVDYQDGKISAQELQHIRFQTWAEKLAVTTQVLNDDYMTAMADICTPLNGAKSMLESLSQYAKLGIITNGFTSLQKIRLAHTGFTPFFDILIISEQVGVAKPARAIFDYALDNMGNPERHKVLMIGDNPYSDIVGGINAGLDTCWLNVDHRPTPEGISPTYQINELSELNALLLTPSHV